MSTINRRQLSRLTPDAAARLRAVAARAGRATGEEIDPAAPAAKAAKPPRTDYLAVKAALQEKLLDEIGERGLLESDGADVASAVQDFAAQTAESWKAGLAEWGQQPERIARLRAAADVAIYTPGSDSGIPLSVLRSFAPPSAELLADAGALRDRVGSVVSGLLSLLGIDADPIGSREHILLSNILEGAWRSGLSLSS